MPRRRGPKNRMARLQKLYNKRARKWGEGYIMRNLWRVGGMYDYEDAKQDAFFMFLKAYRYYPDLPEDDLFRIFKAGIRGRLHNRARECFPNSYAYEGGKWVLRKGGIRAEKWIYKENGNGVGKWIHKNRKALNGVLVYEEGKGKLVLDIDECTLTHSVEHELAFTLDTFSDLFEKLPEELVGVLKLLIRDFAGVSCIEQRRVKRLSGRPRLEPLGIALARVAKLDPSRDLFDELYEAFNGQPITKECSKNVY